MAETDTCRVCGSKALRIFETFVLGRSVSYYQCPTCSYLQTETPTWLEEAYASPINISDTGMLDRNLLNTRRTAAVCLALGLGSARIVDFAGGYGLLVRMLRDKGFPALWSDGYCENLFARGFEHHGEPADVATAFEAFEHYVSPDLELGKMFDIAPTVVISTLLVPDPAPSPETWSYYGREHGQHIGFLHRNTLKFLAEKHNAICHSNGVDFHILTRRKGHFSFTKFHWLMRLWPLYHRFRGSSLMLADHEAMRAADAHRRSQSQSSGNP